MKILYSAGNRLGANVQLHRFLTNLSGEHTIRIAAYVKSSSSIRHINWTLDALHYKIVPKKRSKDLQKIFGHKVPLININNATIFLSEVVDFEPDLIISDGEPISAHIAKTLGVRLWYCSAVHLLDGIDWESGQLRYLSLLENTRKLLSKFPEAEKILVYSPFGDIKFRPTLKNGYEWVEPYYIKTNNVQPIKQENVFVLNDFNRFPYLTRIFNSLSKRFALVSPFSESFTNIDQYSVDDENSYKALVKGCSRFFTTGESSYVADAFYNLKNICIMPSLKDPESLLNSILIREYNIGSDLAQIELMETFAVEEIESILSTNINNNFLSKQDSQQLHQKIEDSCII
jgi:hypothetical protein